MYFIYHQKREKEMLIKSTTSQTRKANWAATEPQQLTNDLINDKQLALENGLTQRVQHSNHSKLQQNTLCNSIILLMKQHVNNLQNWL